MPGADGSEVDDMTALAKFGFQNIITKHVCLLCS